MTEKYVHLKRRADQPNVDAFCPIDEKKHVVIVGLTLIGSVPEGSEVIGEYDEESNKVTLFKEASK